jgi:hypothetical protein
VLFLFGGSVSSRAQSTDVVAPTPISSNDLAGSIAARDIGDARLTHHFYAFSGTPGDVLITVRSKNLNGDVDVFTAGTMRPLLKFTLYAESSTPVTKGIYLRRREDLILRVEARTPNDDEGTYQIRFGGSFEPIAGPLVAEVEAKPEPLVLSAKKGRRVTSAGARINEPPEEVAITPPIETPSPTATPEESSEPARTATPRRGRGRAPGRRTITPRPEVPAPTAKTESAMEKTEPAPTENTEPDRVSGTVTARPVTPARRGGRRGARAATPAPEPEPLSGPRLILELLDGTRVEQYMSTIRRVTVENNQIVVVGKNGKIERKRLSEVVRMAIEP